MISKKDVENIAKLSRLDLTEKEAEGMQKDLSEVLDYFNLLKEVKDKIKLVSVEGKEVLRNDEAKAQSRETIEKLIQAAPNTKGEHVKVKTIL